MKYIEHGRVRQALVDELITQASWVPITKGEDVDVHIATSRKQGLESDIPNPEQLSFSDLLQVIITYVPSLNATETLNAFIQAVVINLSGTFLGENGWLKTIAVNGGDISFAHTKLVYQIFELKDELKNDNQTLLNDELQRIVLMLQGYKIGMNHTNINAKAKTE